MKQLDGYRIWLLLVVLIAVLIVGGGRVNADFTYGTPTNLGFTVNSSANDWLASISDDGFTLFFTSVRPGGYGGRDIWVISRETIDDEWSAPMNLGSRINSSYRDSGPSISADGLSLFFDSDRSGGYGTQDIWVSTRPTRSDPWEAPLNLGATVNSSSAERAPSMSADGLELFFHSDRPGGYGTQDLWVTTRKTTNDPWDPPVNLGLAVNSGTFDGAPRISSDGLVIFFTSARAGGYGDLDIWVTRRASKNNPWGEPANLGSNVNSAHEERGVNISSDGSRLCFGSNRPGGAGGLDLWQVPIEPVVDFNADGIVDKADISIMVDHWGENYSLCDIGPTPLGDGIVDVHDLIILVEHLFEESGGLVGHWKLDETDGGIAYDSAGDNDGYVLGGAIWEPHGGQVGGAIRLDGADGCIMANPVLNPAEGPFSVFAWVQAGAPGQVIVSATAGANWLMLDGEGKLMTEVKSPDPSATCLPSHTVITDGNWHRVGLAWDGSNRMLYVDDAVVGEDTQDGLEGSFNGLYIGCGKNMQPGTYFSGLIDDVRVYNQAVKP
jgi:Tol biopolymer transport system component